MTHISRISSIKASMAAARICTSCFLPLTSCCFIHHLTPYQPARFRITFLTPSEGQSCRNPCHTTLVDVHSARVYLIASHHFQGQCSAPSTTNTYLDYPNPLIDTLLLPCLLSTWHLFPSASHTSLGTTSPLPANSTSSKNKDIVTINDLQALDLTFQ